MFDHKKKTIETPLPRYKMGFSLTGDTVVSPVPLMFLTCAITCQIQAFVAEISCRVIILLRKNVTLAFISYLCFCALPIRSYADRKKL